MNRIYSYYESIAQTNQAEEFACANFWKHSWEKNGWETIMLNKSHAQGSSLYNKLQQKLIKEVMSIPAELQSRIPWIMARFTRLCALHAAGGGWISDYDVLNINMTHSLAQEILGNATLTANKGSAYIIYATKEHAERAIKKIIASDLIKNCDVIAEAELFGIKPCFNAGKSIKHIKSKDGKNRSEIMQSLSAKQLK